MEAGEVGFCFRVVDFVPGLFGYNAAWAGAYAWWWTSHLVEEFEAVVLFFDHLGPGESGPSVCECAARFLGRGLGEAWDEEVSVAGVRDLAHAGWTDVQVR
jgi:hypothetical protein